MLSVGSWCHSRSGIIVNPLLAQDAPDSTLLAPSSADMDAVAVQPVFRAAPYRAEMLRRSQQSTSLKVLFLEEGNACRCGPCSLVAERHGDWLIS